MENHFWKNEMALIQNPFEAFQILIMLSYFHSI